MLQDILWKRITWGATETELKGRLPDDSFSSLVVAPLGYKQYKVGVPLQDIDRFTAGYESIIREPYGTEDPLVRVHGPTEPSNASSSGANPQY